MKKILIILSLFMPHDIYSLDVPYLGGRVNDTAMLLSSDKRASVEYLLKEYELRTTNQIVVLTIPSLEGENLEEYSIKVAEKWKIGQKGKDNGVILLIARDDRALRIEVGLGLEEALTDLKAGRIIDQVIKPQFRAGDYDMGVENGLRSIIAVIGGDESTIPPDEPSAAMEAVGTGLEIGAIILISLFVFGILGVFSAIGIFAPAFPGWFLYAFLIPFYSAFPIALYGQTGGLAVLILHLIGYPALRIGLGRTNFGKKARKWFAASGGSGRSGSSGSSRTSGFSSSSSFSGGGGSFGGGGASGRW